MKLNRHLFLIAIASAMFLALFTEQSLAKQSSSNVLLAQVYKHCIDVRQYMVSEKYDGVRAVWDGKALHTRTGRVIAAPAWFTKIYPKRR